MATTKLDGNVVRLDGNEIHVGDPAPEVTLVNADGLADKKVGGAQGRKQLLVAVPSLDTDVCAEEARKFNQRASEIAGVDVTVISQDLPFAAERFCSTAGITDLTVASDFRDKGFARAYGILIADGPLAGLNARAIFAVDENGQVIYEQLVPEITDEPDYDEALQAVR